MFLSKTVYGCDGVTGEAVRSWRQCQLTSSVEWLPASIANLEEYPEASLGWTSHHKVEVAINARSGNR